jgi:SAM-dependent methyltransferase
VRLATSNSAIKAKSESTDSAVRSPSIRAVAQTFSSQSRTRGRYGPRVSACWNHNTHYHRVILHHIPSDCRRVLDVGCGEGTLTRELRRLVPVVVGIDCDPASIAAARADPGAGDIRYLEGDALTYRFEPGSFDLVTAVASLHHMDAETALARFAGLLRPGGVLALIGLARSSLGGLPIDIAAIVPNRLRRLRTPYWQHPSPTVCPPPESYASMRRIAARVLPGARFQRRLYWRYTLVWEKP